MDFDECADAAEHREQPEHGAGIGDRQEKCLRNVPGEVLEAGLSARLQTDIFNRGGA